VVAQISWRGMAVGERRSSQGHRQGCRGSSQRRCKARGSEEEFRGGSGQLKDGGTMAQWQQWAEEEKGSSR
jgi:hypothetical protein